MSKIAACLLAFLAVLAVLPAVADDLAALPGQVQAIFEAKCIECHGAQLPHPKGKFGYVLDLTRVAANPKMVVRGQPDQSDLYQLLEDDEMPGDGAAAGPLTQDEKDLVKKWIATGAAAVSTPPPPASVAPEAKWTLGQHLLHGLGQFHPPSAHFPIALLILAFPAEILWMLTRQPAWQAIARFCLLLGAFCAVSTATLGWCDAPFTTYTGASAPLLAWHRWIGTSTAVWAVLTAVLAEWARRRENPRGIFIYRLALFLGLVLVSLAGWLGAGLIYGLDHYHW